MLEPVVMMAVTRFSVPWRMEWEHFWTSLCRASPERDRGGKEILATVTQGCLDEEVNSYSKRY